MNYRGVSLDVVLSYRKSRGSVCHPSLSSKARVSHEQSHYRRVDEGRPNSLSWQDGSRQFVLHADVDASVGFKQLFAGKRVENDRKRQLKDLFSEHPGRQYRLHRRTQILRGDLRDNRVQSPHCPYTHLSLDRAFNPHDDPIMGGIIREVSEADDSDDSFPSIEDAV
eukprot:CAMPEP_0204902068 /NCGR_PEP_ID=MMETSP1397-20131031/3448_1 /ASSEMBLY_ACC=CAM_ASM_000891 /TAXON_ID=49980 /ORGANISM="Climacostomum Climacostomum virens, Strain Stock W-24" /LENGTH=166 /DNA_ID=CAMNT_0052070513 /DNA_START=383 /DNA_END=880 /DNA_ORIENTATION=+